MAQGDIGSVIDTYVFDANSCTYPDLLHVSGDVYAITYTGLDTDGYLVTVSIDSDGNIGATKIDAIEFETSKGYIPRLIHIYGTIYAITYANSSADGVVSTISIAADGNIGAALIDSLTFDVWAGEGGKICHVSGQIYAIVFTGYAEDGFVVTVDIDNAGNIGAAEIDRLEFDTTYGYNPAIIQISAAMYAVAYQGPDLDGFVKTFSISGAGDIGAAVIDTLEFDASDCTVPRIIHISGDVYAIAYPGTGGHGTIKTVEITSAGAIGAAPIDTFVFEASSTAFIDFLLLAANLCAVVYQGPGSDGFVKTFSISDAGDIGAAVIDTLEFDTSSCTQLSFRNVSGDVFAIAYSNTSFDGTLKTFDMGTAAPSIIKHFPLMGIG